MLLLKDAIMKSFAKFTLICCSTVLFADMVSPNLATTKNPDTPMFPQAAVDTPDKNMQPAVVNVLKPNNIITINVIGQGLAPENVQSKYHAIALAKRAAIADGYRLLVEKIYGVKVDGHDYIKNMVLQRSEVKTCVSAVIRYVNIVETKCADNFCEVELELKVRGQDWYARLASLP